MLKCQKNSTKGARNFSYAARNFPRDFCNFMLNGLNSIHSLESLSIKMDSKLRAFERCIAHKMASTSAFFELTNTIRLSSHDSRTITAIDTHFNFQPNSCITIEFDTTKAWPHLPQENCKKRQLTTSLCLFLAYVSNLISKLIYISPLITTIKKNKIISLLFNVRLNIFY